MRILNSTNGSMITSLLIFAGAISILAMTGNKIFSNQARKETAQLNRIDLVNTFERVRIATTGTLMCTRMLTNLGPVFLAPMNAAQPLTALDLDSITITTGPNGDSAIDAINLYDIATLTIAHDDSGAEKEHHRVQLELSGRRNINANPLTFTKIFTFDVILAANSSIQSCYRGLDGELTACRVMDGTYDFATGTCDMNSPTEAACNPGECIYGFFGNNQPKCRVLPNDPPGS